MWKQYNVRLIWWVSGGSCGYETYKHESSNLILAATSMCLVFVWYSFWNVGKQKINARIRMSFMVLSYAIHWLTHTATHLSKCKKHTLLQLFQEGKLVSHYRSSRSSQNEHSSLNQAARDLNASCCRAIEDRHPPWIESREFYEVIRWETGQWCR